MGRKQAVENYILSRFFPKDKQINFNEAASFLSQFSKNKQLKNYLISKNVMSKDQYESLTAFEGAFNAIAKIKQAEVLGSSYLDNVVIKRYLITELSQKVVRGTAATAAGRATMPFLGAGSYAVGMSVLDSMSNFSETPQRKGEGFYKTCLIPRK